MPPDWRKWWQASGAPDSSVPQVVSVGSTLKQFVSINNLCLYKHSSSTLSVKALANIHKETHMTVFLKKRKKLDSHQQEDMIVPYCNIPMQMNLMSIENNMI